MSGTSVQETGRVAKKPVPNIMLFANGSLASFGIPKISHYTQQLNDGTERQVALCESVPVFRSGSFTSMEGDHREWEPEDLRDMVASFPEVSKRLCGIPVRAGHRDPKGGGEVRGILGYVTKLDTEVRKSPLDGLEYTYLLADYEILDKEAEEKIGSGLWRNRSSEIGSYQEFSPCFLGVAYVDFSAVGGLNAYAKQFETANYSIQMEAPVSTPIPTVQLDDPPKPQFGQRHEFSIGGVTTTDPARVQTYIADLEKEKVTFAAQITDLTNQNAALKEFKDNSIKAARENQIAALGQPLNGQPPRLTEAQMTEVRSFCALLGDDQFAAYMKTFENAPPAPILGTYGVQTPAQVRPGEPQPEHTEKDDLRDIVLGMKRFSGMPDDKIKESKSYKRLLVLDNTFTL